MLVIRSDASPEPVLVTVTGRLAPTPSGTGPKFSEVGDAVATTLPFAPVIVPEKFTSCGVFSALLVKRIDPLKSSGLSVEGVNVTRYWQLPKTGSGNVQSE